MDLSLHSYDLSCRFVGSKGFPEIRIRALGEREEREAGGREEGGRLCYICLIKINSKRGGRKVSILGENFMALSVVG